MSIHLHDHEAWTAQLPPESRALLERQWSDAAKVLSARGLDNYVKGASALRRPGPGRGPGGRLDRRRAPGGARGG